MQIEIASLEDISTIRDIAYRTWPSAYKEILSVEQLNYMLEMMYNPQTLENQFNNPDYHFLLSKENNTTTGFASYSYLQELGLYKLHKLYVLPEKQSKGHLKTTLINLQLWTKAQLKLSITSKLVMLRHLQSQEH